MTKSISDLPASTLRQRMIEDMNLRQFARKTQFDYIRHVKRFAAWFGRPPDTATAEDLRQFQVEQRDAGLGIPTMNSIVAALRFFLTHTIVRPDLSRKLYTVKNPRSLPIILSPDEVIQLREATTCLKHKAALSVAYGAGLRAAEVTMLKVRDVDSKRMLLRVERGKGGRYRNALLPADLLTLLREWWTVSRQQGVMHADGWLFPGMHYLKPLSTRLPGPQVAPDGRAAAGLTRGRRHLPRCWTRVPGCPCRAPEPCPAQGDVGDRELPHRGIGRSR